VRGFGFGRGLGFGFGDFDGDGEGEGEGGFGSSLGKNTGRTSLAARAAAPLASRGRRTYATDTVAPSKANTISAAGSGRSKRRKRRVMGLPSD
jgi:hypothetical protein